MAATNVISVITMSLTSIVTLSSQLQSLILLWKLHMSKMENFNNNLLLRKRSYSLQKMKRARERRINRKKRSCWFKQGRTDLWWQNILTGVAPYETWKKNFRMTCHVFQHLVNELRPYISPDPLSPNCRALSPEKKVAITLYYLKDTGSLSMTANSFGIAVCTASAVIIAVCKAISKFLGPKYIYLPKNQNDMRKKVSEFETKFGMTQAFGCIDGTHVPVRRPLVNSQDYFCYKQYFSLSVQAICDYRGYFMDVECMWPGSVHDAKVFANSSINMKLRNAILPQTFQMPIQSAEKIPNYLIGDPAYPLVPFCMKEYEHCSNNAEVIFNNMLRSARNPIECAFGRLKARWAILTRKVDLKLEAVPSVIYACFVLHNLCEKNKSYVDEEQVKVQIHLMENSENQHKNTPDPIYSVNEAEGSVIRRTLTDLICENI